MIFSSASFPSLIFAFPSTALIAGHEIVGEVVRAGKDSGHKVGERVGVGAQAGSCLECAQCKDGKEVRFSPS